MCGESWFNVFQEGLSYEGKHQIVFTKCDNQYKFGDGAYVTVVSRAIIPITIGTIKTKMYLDIIPSIIPLLLSKESMKQANMKLTVENDTITACGQPINLILTKSGHYAISTTNNKHILNDLNTTYLHITPILTNSKSDKDIAVKLHRQFAHPTSNKLMKLINSASQEWRSNENLKAEILKSNK